MGCLYKSGKELGYQMYTKTCSTLCQTKPAKTQGNVVIKIQQISQCPMFRQRNIISHYEKKW